MQIAYDIFLFSARLREFRYNIYAIIAKQSATNRPDHKLHRFLPFSRIFKHSRLLALMLYTYKAVSCAFENTKARSLSLASLLHYALTIDYELDSRWLPGLYSSASPGASSVYICMLYAQPGENQRKYIYTHGGNRNFARARARGYVFVFLARALSI